MLSIMRNRHPPYVTVHKAPGQSVELPIEPNLKISELMETIATHYSIPVGHICLDVKNRKSGIGNAEFDRFVKDFDWGKEGEINFHVEIDSDKEYENARKLVVELDNLLLPHKPRFIQAEYGYPMLGKYGEYGKKHPGVVVSLRKENVKDLELMIRRKYPNLFEKHIPIYIDEWD